MVGADDPVAARLGARRGAALVGSAPGSTYRIEGVDAGEGVSFALQAHGAMLGRVSLPVTGAKIATNAAVAVAASLEVGVPFEAAQRALARFAGVARRFEARGEAGGVRYVDDYAHLPSEVAAVIDGGARHRLRVASWWCSNRTATPGSPRSGAIRRRLRGRRCRRGHRRVRGGGDTLAGSDRAASSPTPCAGPIPTSTSPMCPGRAELRAHVAGVLVAGDLCLTLGAGDLTSLPDELQAATPW